MRPLELTGQQFGRLRVISRAQKTSDGAVWWNCSCECGATKSARGADLKRGFIQSCGCWNREVAIRRSTTHGQADTRIYKIWQAMRNRTGNPRASKYKYYGGRGISVCGEWQSFKPFYDWSMTHGYAETLSIDRYPDKNGNYEPDNCRWTTQTEQVRNRRTKAEIIQQRETTNA